MEQIQLWDIDTIVTFDSCGVSGQSKSPRYTSWHMVSLNIFRKYSGAVDIWLSYLISFSSSKQTIYTIVNSSPSKSFQAMAAQRSQWVWFRRLFLMFSSYTYINMLQKI